MSTSNNTGVLSRRDFLKSSAFVGGAALTVSGCALASEDAQAAEYLLNDPEHFIYSVCLQCHTSCPIKVKLQNGNAVKIDGNPFAVQTLRKPVSYDTGLTEAGLVDGRLCPKGQAGIQSLYDPYRIRKILKRAGKRGEDKWVTIPFSQAMDEIVNGGKLFSTVSGEEDRIVPGLKDIFKMRDAGLSKKMASDAMAVGKGKLPLKKFKKKYADHLDLLIDPDHPDFGPVNNQFVFQAGRIEHGRKELVQRWLGGSLGSINWFDHTSICEQSHHIAYGGMTDQYSGGKWAKGKHHMKPDLYESEFVIFFGTGAFEANFGPPILTELVTDGLVSGRLKIAVVDPRHSKTASKAWKWAPVLPGTDAAFAYGMMHWMFDNNSYDQAYLKHANKAAAHEGGETTWSNSSWLVRIEKDGPGKLLRASDIGLGNKDTFVTTTNGRPVAIGSQPLDGDLFFSGTIEGIKVKSSFQLLTDYVQSRTMDQWAKECGVEPDLIVDLAREFVRHGKKSVAELYRGPVQHTNGYYNAQAIISLNVLVGNPDWRGGLSVGGGHWHEDGTKSGQPFDAVKGLHKNKLKTFGHRIIRDKAHYEDSSLFRENGYPAKRPWFPNTSNVYQEIIPSVGDAYPYPIKALFLHKGTPALAAPGGHKMIDVLVDTERLPLLMACDIVIGETSMYADYLFPDTAVWERFATPHTTPAAPIAQSKIRQPTIEPLVESAFVFGEEVPINLEAVVLGVAERLNLTGFGKDGFGSGMPLTRQEDFYLKLFANLAAGDKPGHEVPDPTDEETRIFFSVRSHLSKRVFDPDRYQQSLVDASGRNWWKKVITIMNRGGRFEDISVYEKPGTTLPHKFGKQFNLYVEKVAMSRHPYSGERFSGIGLFEPIRGYNTQVIADDSYSLRLITYKMITGGQSRTLADYWLKRVNPENPVLINTATAERLGLSDGDSVRLESASNPTGEWDLKNGRKIEMIGNVHRTEGIHPDVVAVSWHYGHWAYGANDAEVDGVVIKGDPGRSSGLCPNAAMRLDPTLKNVCLQDLIGGSSSFYDTRINLARV